VRTPARPLVLLAASAALVTGAAAASAAPKKPAPVKPVCNLVVDEPNDTFLLRTQEGVAAGPQEDALDVVSADLASDAKRVTAVIRVKKLATTIATGVGQGYELQFLNDGDNTLYLSATITNGSQAFTVGFRDPTANTATSLGDASGVFDLAKNEVRISAPVSVFSAQGTGVKPGKLLSIGTITASRNLVAVDVFADVNEGGATYKAGAPSCVTPGK
jgi:hypothetical protein